MVLDQIRDVLDDPGVIRYHPHLNHPTNYRLQSHEEGIHWLMSFVDEEIVMIAA